MIDRPDEYRDDARSPRETAETGPARRATDRPHHMVVSDGELLDIGPDAETIDEADVARRTPPDLGAAEGGGARREPGPEQP